MSREVGGQRSPERFHAGIDIALIVISLQTTLGVLIPAWWFAPAVIYVSPSGSDWASGSNVESPRRSLQRAVDLARPGTEIVLLPGIYRERVHVRRGGQPGRRVVIRAAEPGSVVITAASNPSLTIDENWKAHGDRIFSRPMAHPVYALKCGQTWAFRVPWSGLDQLRKLARRPNSHLAFCVEGERLAVHVPAEWDPRELNFEIHRTAPAPREWGELKSANLWIEAAHLELHGLQCEFGLGAGILLWDAEDVLISDCTFSGANHGIDGRRGLRSCRELTVRRCWYDHFPQYDWHQGWLSHDETYAAYATSSLALLTESDAVVEDNLVTHAGDGLQITAPERVGMVDLSVVRRNWICWATDDALECDGPGGGLLVEENLIYDCHEAFSFCPLTAGPVRVERNLSLHEAGGINGASFKLIEAEIPSRPIRRIRARDNLVLGHWGCWHSQPDLFDVTLDHNLLALRRTESSQWPSRLTMRENWIVPRGETDNRPRGPQGLLDELDASLPAPSAEWPTNHPARAAIMSRPGPRWLDWQSHPALRELSHRTATKSDAP